MVTHPPKFGRRPSVVLPRPDRRLSVGLPRSHRAWLCHAPTHRTGRSLSVVPPRTGRSLSVVPPRTGRSRSVVPPRTGLAVAWFRHAPDAASAWFRHAAPPPQRGSATLGWRLSVVPPRSDRRLSAVVKQYAFLPLFFPRTADLAMLCVPVDLCNAVIWYFMPMQRCSGRRLQRDRPVATCEWSWTCSAWRAPCTSVQPTVMGLSLHFPSGRFVC